VIVSTPVFGNIDLAWGFEELKMGGVRCSNIAFSQQPAPTGAASGIVYIRSDRFTPTKLCHGVTLLMETEDSESLVS
jgi:hypothetical protein